MNNQIIDVEYDNNITLLARIIEDNIDHYTVSCLNYCGDGMYEFDDEFLKIEKETVSGFYDTKKLEETGLYRRVGDNNYEPMDSDSDYDDEDDDDEDDDEDSGSDISYIEEEFF
jgi:hypothetical protein